MEANVSDELIEAMARELAKADNIEICSDASYALSAYGIRARALLPVIRAHLEPTSEMVEAVMDCGPIGCCNISSTEARDIILSALKASPIGDVG